MSRSNFKGPVFTYKFDKYVKNKNFVILPKFINKFFFIYNGKNFIKLKISENMIGYKFGEFISTRAVYKFKKNKKLKKNEIK